VADYVESLLRRGLISKNIAARLAAASSGQGGFGDPNLQEQAGYYDISRGGEEYPGAMMPMSPPSFADRLAAYGAPPSKNVEDRSGEAESGYGHMLAMNNLVGSLVRHLFPSLRSLDMPMEPKYRQRQAGQLREQAGYYNINRGK
jgi:hypothetical protein